MRDARPYKYKAGAHGRDMLIQGFMSRVYLWMTMGLCITGIVSLYAVGSPGVIGMLRDHGLAPFFILLLAELVLVVYLSSQVMKLKPAAASVLFFLFAAMNGLMIAPVFLVFTRDSIASAFFVSAGMFGAMSLYGTVTARDLSTMRGFLMMGLFGIIIASLVNLFMRSEMIMWVTTYIGVFVFLGLTAYDTQKLRDIASKGEMSEDIRGSLAVLGALTLYLDFINIFLKILRIMNRRK